MMARDTEDRDGASRGVCVCGGGGGGGGANESEKSWRKRKLNELNLGKQASWQQVEPVRLSSDLLQTSPRERPTVSGSRRPRPTVPALEVPRGGVWWTEFSGLINKQGLCPLIFVLPHRKERAGDTGPVVV